MKPLDAVVLFFQCASAQRRQVLGWFELVHSTRYVRGWGGRGARNNDHLGAFEPSYHTFV